MLDSKTNTPRSSYAIGVSFLIVSLLVGSTNDVIMKFVGNRLSSLEVIFFRFLFGFITLVPFIIIHGKAIFHTQQMGMQIVRAVLGFISLTACAYGVVLLTLAESTIVFWTIPIFTLILSSIFLKEKIPSQRWIATITALIGLAILVCPDGVHLKPAMFVPIGAAFLFAVQDVMAKRMIVDEDRITMLLYFAIGTTLLSLFPTLFVWETPTAYELFILFLLGAGGNLIQYFLFRAFSATDLSALAPFRYTDFIFSSLFGWVFFGEVLGTSVYLGVAVIVPSTLYLVYSEIHTSRGTKKGNTGKNI
ncbi:MAG: DMT family transporter [Holosporales bacterium]|jgi:S-adenosylmethionine uptake transporter|nr:DMT family transporter [Holosporales bacterium]